MTIRVEEAPALTRALFRISMALFLITVVIGLLNGLDVMEFDRGRLLTHVHSGTLGWITLGVFAATLWLFSESQRIDPRWPSRWSYGAAVAILVFVVAFWNDNLPLRAVFGALSLLAIAGFTGWALVESRRSPLTIPRLAILAALVSVALGSVLGVLLALKMAGRADWLPAGVAMAHPPAMMIGFVVVAGMAITEWRLLRPPRLAREDRWGVVQVALLFLGGLAATVGAILDNFALLGLNVPLQVLGTAIFLVRLGSRLWRARPGDRVPWYQASVVFLVVDVMLIAYLISGVLTGRYADLELIPPWIIFALGHAMFVGLMTNGLFGLMADASRQRSGRWPWADRLAFAAMNLGMVGFVIGLMLQEPALKRGFAPLMGLGILLAMAVYAVRLQPLTAPTAATSEGGG